MSGQPSEQELGYGAGETLNNYLLQRYSVILLT